jgi:hypothetical protein
VVDGAFTWRPWNYSAAGTSSWSQYGYSATTDLTVLVRSPITSLNDPFQARSCNLPEIRWLTNVGASTNIRLPNKAPKVQQLSRDIEREFRGGVMLGAGYRPSRKNLDWQTDQHQSARSEVPDTRARHAGVGAQSVLRNPQAGQFASRQTMSSVSCLVPSAVRRCPLDRRNRRASQPRAGAQGRKADGLWVHLVTPSAG